MTLNEATDRAATIWVGKEIAVWREQVGSGAYVQINGDERMHRLDHNGHVACLHDDCLKRERLADFGPQPVETGRKIARMRYAVVIEKGPTSYGAHVPDLPGCAAVGDTEAKVRTLIREAIEAHIEGLRAAGQGVPEPATVVDYVEAGR